MTRPDLEAIVARCEAATAGPWRIAAVQLSDSEIDVIRVDADGRDDLIASVQYVHGAPSSIQYNADLIAHAREDLPALVKYVAAQDVEIADLRQALEDVSAHRDRLAERVSRLEAALRRLREFFALGPLEAAAKYGDEMDWDQFGRDACRVADKLLAPEAAGEGEAKS